MKNYMPKTRKILDIHHGEHKFTCIYDTEQQYNRYKLYEHTVTWDSDMRPTYHKKLVEKYADFHSVLSYIEEAYRG